MLTPHQLAFVNFSLACLGLAWAWPYVLAWAGWARAKLGAAPKGQEPYEELWPQRAVLFLGLFGSLTQALWLPPFAGPDEYRHWYRAVHVSSGHVLSHKDAAGHLGALLPVWAEDLYLAAPMSTQGGNKQLALADWQRAKEVPYSTTKRFVPFAATAMYPPAFYAPQALAIKAGRVLHLRPFDLFYLTRIANTCAAWLIMAGAMALAPELVVWWSALLLMPVVLQQLGTVSADACLIAVTLLLAALIGRAASTRRKEPWLWPVITACIGLLGQTRPPLVALVALLWMPALARHSTRPIWAARVGHTLLAWALAFPWFVGCLIWGVRLRSDLPTVHDKALLMAHEPRLFGQLFMRTTTAHADDYLWMLVGHLGWLDTSIDRAFFFWAKAALVLALLASLHRPYRLGARDAACVWLAMVGSYVGMQVIFFLTWTTPNAPAIEGFQGRYAMMFLPLLPLALPRLRLGAPIKRALWLGATLASISLIFQIPQTLLQRYYLAGP